jgi:hypothetical protein
MNIELFVSEDGRAVFTCDAEFEKPVEEIILNPETGLVYVSFIQNQDVVELNCAVDMEICEKLKDALFCAIGYFKGGKLSATEYVRFRTGTII